MKPGRADWTESYRQWELWDIEQRKQEEQEAKQREEAKQRASKDRMARKASRDRSAERRVFDMSWEAKLSGCRRFRDRGNAFFKEGALARAAVQYEAALAWYEYTFPPEEHVPKIEKERVLTLCNLAACQLRLRRAVDAENTCTLAISADPKAVKAWFRRATARRLQHKFEEARQDLLQASRLVKDSPQIQREARLLSAMISVSEKRSKEMSRRMFPLASENPDLDKALAEMDVDRNEADPDDDQGSVTGPPIEQLLQYSEQNE